MGAFAHAPAGTEPQRPVARQRPELVALPTARQVERLEHCTSQQPQDACLINDRYGGSARGKVSRSAAPKPNQHAPGGILASVSWHLAAVRADSAAGRGRTLGAEQVTAGVQSGIAHGARAGTSLLPQLLSAFPQEICRLAAGWLSEGADNLRRPPVAVLSAARLVTVTVASVNACLPARARCQAISRYYACLLLFFRTSINAHMII
ncbi:hypothetical protein Q7P35_010355 [Cladosporium inversicolor]